MLLSLDWPWTPLGRRGENAADRYLRRLGYRIIARSYRCSLGELDIVARLDPILAFVEVRTRANADHGEPWETIRSKKQRKLTALAAYFLKQHGQFASLTPRFDVVSVEGSLALFSRPKIQHFSDAFPAVGPWNP